MKKIIVLLTMLNVYAWASACQLLTSEECAYLNTTNTYEGQTITPHNVVRIINKASHIPYRARHKVEKFIQKNHLNTMKRFQRIRISQDKDHTCHRNVHILKCCGRLRRGETP